MPSLRVASAFLVLAGFGFLAENGCGGSCTDTFVVSFIDSLPALDVQGPCELTLTNKDRVARYSLAAPVAARDAMSPLGDGGIEPPPGAISCGGSTATSCVAIAGPSLSPCSCYRTGSDLWLESSEKEAHAIADFLGAQSFEVKVTCARGYVVLEQRSVTTQTCAL